LPVGFASVSGSPYLGVYLRVGERLAVLPKSAPAALDRQIARLFGVSTIRTTVREIDIVGAMIAMNSHGVVVGDMLDDEEEEALAPLGPIKVIASRQNAMGNNVLANDVGALVHPEFSDEAVRAIGRALKVPAHRATLAGLGTVGMCGAVTPRGVVVHPRATPKEAERAETILRVPVHRSTANFGVPIVGACVIANSRGLAVGRPTTPVELVHLQEGFQIFD
jgi:translation initiation factor 6